MLNELLSPAAMILAAIVGLVAGFVKGAVGFGMPMIMIAALGSFMKPDLALAALIVPTVVSNLWQAMRGGFRQAFGSVWQYRLLIGLLLIFIIFGAQFVSRISSNSMLLISGIPVSLFALSQLLGWSPRLKSAYKWMAEIAAGIIGGFVGGMTGVWGPPTVVYLTAMDTPKAEHVRVQGVIYGAGSLVLLASHLQTGLLNAQTLPISVLMCIPTISGMVLGLRLHDRLDQQRFRRATLLVLVLAGINLIRRGLWG